MSRCKNSPKKKRTSPTGKGNPSDYRHGMKGHTWEKVKGLDGEHLGRQCVNCKLIKLNPLGKLEYS